MGVGGDAHTIALARSPLFLARALSLSDTLVSPSPATLSTPTSKRSVDPRSGWVQRRNHPHHPRRPHGRARERESKESESEREGERDCQKQKERESARQRERERVRKSERERARVRLVLRECQEGGRREHPAGPNGAIIRTTPVVHTVALCLALVWLPSS